tara:strand:- start:5630 stop:5872 length:243 start_codon:yes stop_codon:yes gene_type:complete
MANYNFITSSPDSMQDSSKEFKETTATPFVTPTWSSVTFTTSTPTVENFTFGGLTPAERWPLQGRRPGSGLYWPRGVYNK